jgi:uncharacterized protein YggT (Ycf19 family)
MNEEAGAERERIQEREPYGEPSKRTGVKAIRFIDTVFWILEAFIIIRFIFKLVGANAQNQFVTIVYQITNPLIVFFQGIVKDITTTGGNVFEISSLIALVILWLLYLAIIKLINVYSA